jgi:hypothetical protein
MFGKGQPQKWPGFTPPRSRKMPPLRGLLLLRRVHAAPVRRESTCHRECPPRPPPRLWPSARPPPQAPAIAADPSNEKALFWNPEGASFEQALALLGTRDGSVGVIGGTDVFGTFLDRYDVFHLSRAPDVRLPGGRPVFPEVPTRTPEEVLASHGLDRGQRQVLDPAIGLVIVSWQRSSKPD